MRASIRRIAQAFRSFRRCQPFTLRGVLVALGALVALKHYALPQSDLIAYMIGGGAIGILALLLIFGAWLRVALGSRLEAKLFFAADNPLSQRPIAGRMIFKGSSLLPFFQLTVQRRFQHSGVNSPVHLLQGAEEHSRVLEDTVVFPHRGLWKVEALEMTVGDSLGLLSLTWDLPAECTLEVSALEVPHRPLPIVAASSRAGDELNLSRDRTGDLYDMKAYDPSDGVNRILWKTFAKSAQLIVRRPEPALIPEGEVAVYLVAEPQDDHVAGALVRYLRQLAAADVVVLFGTDGIQENPLFGSEAKDFYTDLGEIRHAVNLCVWDPAVGTGSGFGAFLDALEETQHCVQRVVVFAPARLGHWLSAMSDTASRRQIKLAVALVPQTLLRTPRAQQAEAHVVRETSTAAMLSGAEVMVCEEMFG